MKLFGGVISISGITYMMFAVFIIAALGYLLGRITIKGVSLGTAGVFVVAILFGALFSNTITQTVVQNIGGHAENISSNILKTIENIGLVLFVTSVGFIAGPNFFKNLKKNFKSYILLGVVIIVSGGLACIACYYMGVSGAKDTKEFAAILVGALSGALTSTPAFSSSKAAVAPQYEDAVTVGYGIAYLFGVIGVVLFVQLMPKILKADINEERKKIAVVDTGKKTEVTGKLIEMDDFGIMPFALAAVIGVLVGAIKIPLTSKGLSGTCFSLTTTGGALITALVFGHFGNCGIISLKVKDSTAKVFREFGLMLFLIGAGVAGGTNFVKYFKPIYFVYGMIMTLVPMIIGFIVAKYVLKLNLLNNLGAITGGMTSTPALGTLIHVSGTEDVASAYAATYPIALISVVLISQGLCLFLG